jgi:hypothetical protein
MPRTAWNKRITPDLERQIVAQYEAGLPASTILATLPFKTRKTVYDVLEKHGIPRRGGVADYKRYDQTVFANVDTEEKAYWLGMLVADGYVIDSRRDCELQIGLQLVDAEHVERFRAFLGSPNPVVLVASRSERARAMHRVVVHSDRMARDLAKFGVVPRKTRNTYLPLLNRNLMPHLLRGVFDGDGTVSRRGDGGVLFGYCGSPRFIHEVRMWLICTLGLADNRVASVGSSRVIQWTGREDVRKLARYLYGTASVYLQRKYELVRGLL